MTDEIKDFLALVLVVIIMAVIVLGIAGEVPPEFWSNT